jgi:hypothetical protein
MADDEPIPACFASKLEGMPIGSFERYFAETFGDEYCVAPEGHPGEHLWVSLKVRPARKPSGEKK